MNKHALKWLWKVLGRKKLHIAFLMIAQAVSGAAGVLEVLLLKNVVDSAVARESEAFWRSLLLIVLLVAGLIALGTLIRWERELSRAVFENSLKDRLMRQLLRRDYAAVSAVHSGEWMHRLTSDTVIAAGGCLEILPGL